MKFVRYVVDAGGEVHIPPIDAPQSTFKTAEEAVELSLKWENDVTQYVNGLMEIALGQKDYIARTFLDWFETEQLEEVSSMENLLRVVRMAGERNLIMLEAYISHNGD
jgi:ferritin